MRSVVRTLALCACSVLLGGCGGNAYLHSETREKQGQAAKEAWQAVDLRGSIGVARENLAALAERELKTTERLALARRDALLRKVVAGQTIEEELLCPTGLALRTLVEADSVPSKPRTPCAKKEPTPQERTDRQQLAAASLELARTWVDTWEARETQLRIVASVRHQFEDAGYEMPACTDILADKAEALQPLQDAIKAGGQKASTLRQALGAAQRECRHASLADYDKAQARLGGSVRKTAGEVQLAKAELEKARDATMAARNAYRAALAAHEKAVEERKTDPKAGERLRSAAEDLQKAVDTLKKAKDPFSQKFLSEQRIDSLQRFLSALVDSKEGEVPPEGSSRAAVALLLFSDLADNTRKALAEAQAPLLLPLVIQKNHEKIKLDAATRDVAAWEAAVANRQQKLAWMRKQAKQYVDTYDGLDKHRKFHARMLDDALAALPAPKPGESAADRRRQHDEQNELLVAVARFADAEGRLRGEIRKTDTRANAMEYERALAYSESNVAQWDNLITNGVDQLAQWGAGGLKAERITSFINSMTLFWIGSRVN